MIGDRRADADHPWRRRRLRSSHRHGRGAGWARISTHRPVSLWLSRIAVATELIPRCRPMPTQSFLTSLRSVAHTSSPSPLALVGDAVRNPSSATVPGVGSSRPRRLLAAADAQPWRWPVQGDHRLRFRRLGRLEGHVVCPRRDGQDDARHGRHPRPRRRAEGKNTGIGSARSPPAGGLAHPGDAVRHQDRRRDRAISDRKDFLPGPDHRTRTILFGTAARAREIAAIAPNGGR